MDKKWVSGLIFAISEENREYPTFLAIAFFALNKFIRRIFDISKLKIDSNWQFLCEIVQK